MDLIADTSFLVGIWRGQSWARNYAIAHPTQSLALPWIVLGEFWHGTLRAGHNTDQVREFLEIGVHILDPLPVVAEYAAICATLQDQPGWREIGQNDLWIAATALAFQKPLITRNQRHFSRIVGLQLVVIGK